MTRRQARAVTLWAGLLALVIAGLYCTGDGALGTPALTSSKGWSAWLTGTDPVVVAFALIRLLALAAAWYALAATVLATASRFCGAGALEAVFDRLTVPVLRRVLAASLSAGMATGGLGALATGAAAEPTGPRPTLTMHRLSEGAGPAAAPTAVASTAAAPPTSSTSPAPGSPAVTDLAGPRHSGAPVEWRVAPGQCFWTIADDVLTEALGRAASDAEIVPYWRRLIEANRGALADRENPDLIFPGQVFTVPAP